MARTKQSTATPAVHTEPKGKRTVVVACKFPAGIVLQLCRKVEFVEEGIGGTRIQRVRHDKEGQAFTVRGPARPNGQTPKGYKHAVVEGGYALTSGIPEEFWNEWLRQNEKNPLVVNKMIFASVIRDHAEGHARENESRLSGFEPLIPDTDSRIPKSINAGVGSIETATPGT